MGDIKITTKSDTWLLLRDIVKKSFIEEMTVIKVKDYLEREEEVLKAVSNTYSGDNIVVRSSVKTVNSEYPDAMNHFCVYDIPSCDEDEVASAFDVIIASYRDEMDDVEGLGTREILIQRQATDIIISGVIHTRDIIYNRPYYVVTYRDYSDGQITKEKSKHVKWIAKNVSREFIDEKFYKLIDAAKEIEKIYSDMEALDIEFAIDKSENIIIFMVKPLGVMRGKQKPISDHDFSDTKAFAKCHYLDNNKFLSDKAYWNPSGALGINPRPLDYSIYRSIITDSIWNDSITELGYSEVADELMLKIGNRPYITINNAFEALTPSAIDKKLKHKLLEYYNNQLLKDRKLHDKVETELVFNAYDFSTDDNMRKLIFEGFTKEETVVLRDALYNITASILYMYDDMCKRDMKALAEIREVRENIIKATPVYETNSMKLYGYIKQLLDSIRDDGTPQYARHGRCAYIAMSFCNTLVDKKFFTGEEMDEFLGSISTVETDYNQAVLDYNNQRISKEEFNSRYGYMRISAYDIRTECARNLSQVPVKYNAVYCDLDEVKFLDEDKLALALEAAYINDITPKVFMDYIVKSIKNMELFKHEYTQSISLVLDIIERIGDIQGIAKEDMSYLEIQDLLSYHSRDTYIQMIAERRTMYHANSYLVLPDVICGVGDIDVVDVCE